MVGSLPLASSGGFMVMVTGGGTCCSRVSLGGTVVALGHNGTPLFWGRLGYLMYNVRS